MATSTPETINRRQVRIFVSSPGDVKSERDQCGDAIAELNQTLAALLPSAGVELELLRWETHTHPDLAGEPQQAVDDQLRVDYEIFIGIMWTRFGTPTSSGGSGTEHEFRQAYKGWQERRRPTYILFYFCEADIPAGIARDGADQLKAVAAFRSELLQLGLIGNYERRDRFSDKIRRDLVHVLSRLLNSDEPPAVTAVRVAERSTSADREIVWRQIAKIAEEYQSLRRSMPSGPERTRRMEVVASRMRTLAQAAFPLLSELVKQTEPGMTLAALTTLQAIPDVRYLDWIAEQVRHEQPFIGYHAAVALLAGARELPDRELGELEAALSRAKAYASRLRPDTDRSLTLSHTRSELDRRSSLIP